MKLLADSSGNFPSLFWNKQCMWIQRRWHCNHITCYSRSKCEQIFTFSPYPSLFKHVCFTSYLFFLIVTKPSQVQQTTAQIQQQETAMMSSCCRCDTTEWSHYSWGLDLSGGGKVVRVSSHMSTVSLYYCSLGVFSLTEEQQYVLAWRQQWQRSHMYAPPSSPPSPCRSVLFHLDRLFLQLSAVLLAPLRPHLLQSGDAVRSQTLSPATSRKPCTEAAP